MALNIVHNDGAAHQYTVYIVNSTDIAQGATSCGFVQVIPRSGTGISHPVSFSGNTLRVNCNMRKPLYVWAYKEGRMSSYPYINSTVPGKSVLHVSSKSAYASGRYGLGSYVNVTINNAKSYRLGFSGSNSLMCSAENPDFEDIAGWVSNIPITINSIYADTKAPARSFGIGVAFYGTHENPARDLDKAIVY